MTEYQNEGSAIGHAMAELAGDNAGEVWKEIAYDAFVTYAREHPQFTTEDVRRANPELPPPPDNRAWGAIARRGTKNKIIVSLGWVRAKNLNVHGRAVVNWQSKICG
jgi:hypothetical protein